ncbi:MAG TPA: 3-oxoacyl-ACP reductase FabG [Clostridiales bacterium]|nr:3-oxoacyl-ACP reductase FabG [Clostridiales bacterium]
MGKPDGQKTVLITGASGGIGRTTALLFSQKGYAVALHYHTNQEAAESLCRLLMEEGRKAIAVGADLSDPFEAEAAVAKAENALGPIDVLVNNAGFADQRLFCDISSALWKKMMDVHVNAAFYCTKAVLPSMIRRKSGNIINVSSMWGQVGASCEVHYSTAKAALIGMTKALAKEVGPSGIRVNCVAPGVIATAMLSGFSAEDLQALAEGTPLGRLGTPEDVARAILFLASDESSFITGQVVCPNGGLVI